MMIAFFAALAFAGADPAAAAPPAGDAPASPATNPSPSEIEALVGGSVVLVCKTTRRGTVKDCVVEKEDPPGLGFGAKAIRMAAEFRMRGPADGSSMEGGTLRIPMTFKPMSAREMEKAAGKRNRQRVPVRATPAER